MSIYRELAKRGEKTMANHPWLQLFQDTLERVHPNLFAHLQSEHELLPWAITRAFCAWEASQGYQQDGMSEHEANSLALSECLPSTPADEMPYDAAEEAAAEEEGAAEAFDIISRNRKHGA